MICWDQTRCGSVPWGTTWQCPTVTLQIGTPLYRADKKRNFPLLQALFFVEFGYGLTY